MSNSISQKAYNKAHGLPESWRPPQYLGPKRDVPPALTPKGIRVRHNGFKGQKHPEFMEKIRARVILSRVDEIWKEVRDYLANENPYKLEPPRIKKLKGLPDNLPGICIEPSIWWAEAYGMYFGGLYYPMQGGISVAVWYKPVTAGAGIINWESILRHEFQHLALQWAGANMYLADGYAESVKVQDV